MIMMDLIVLMAETIVLVATVTIFTVIAAVTCIAILINDYVHTGIVEPDGESVEEAVTATHHTPH